MFKKAISRRAYIRSCAAASMLPGLMINHRQLGIAAEAYGESQSEKMWLKPPGLKKGDLIALVAPAGPADRSLVLAYQQQLLDDGFRVLLDEKMPDRKSGYLAGQDKDRIEELNLALRDPNVRGIFPVRGGFGLTRILDQIDFAALRNDPKIIIGYSDLTALHLAIARKSRVISFHSPMPMSNLVHCNLPEHEYANSSFARMLFCDRYPQSIDGTTIEIPAGEKILKIKGGKSQGRLMGGNLSLLCATLGTPFAVEPKGTILFMEDVNEAPYRVDRLMSQLRLACVLESVEGIIVGQFTNKDPGEAKQIDQIIAEYATTIRCPMIANFPIGHVPNNATLPHGARVELDADRGVVVFREDPCIR